MKIKNALAGAALLLAVAGLSTASAQMSPPNGMHNDSHDRGGPGGPGTGGGMHRGDDGSRGGRGPGMDRGHDARGDRGHGWKRPHHKRCRTVWHNHHRVKRCY